MTAALPLCVVGGGQIGLRHAQVAQGLKCIRLTAVVEPVAARRADLAAMGLPAVAALQDVPGDTRAAVIATPTQDHASAGQAALARGWGVIVEKPLGATIAECRALIAAAAAAGLPLVTGHHRRCHPFTRAARTRLSGLGAPVGVQALWSLRKHDSYFDVPWRRAPGAGVMMTNLSHEIDLLHFLLGDLAEVSAMLSTARRGLTVEDTAALSLRFANGALGSVLMSDAGASPWGFEAASGENPMLAASGADYLRIVCEGGALAFPSLRIWRGSDWRASMQSEGAEAFAAVDPLAEQMSRFAGLLGGGADDTLCTGAQGLAATAATLACALSGAARRPVRPDQVPEDYTGTGENP